MRIRTLQHVKIEQARIDLARRTVAVQLLTVDAVNLNGLIMRKQAITNALDFWMRYSQAVGEMHVDMTGNFPVRVWQDWDGSGWVEIYVKDDASWEGITSGKFTGLSWAGYAMVDQLPDGTRECIEYAEMWEASLVDVPAVPEAVWNSQDQDGSAELLIDKLSKGKIKPRVIHEEARRQGIVQSLVETLLNALNNVNPNPASGGESTEQESDMTLAELQAALAANNTALIADLDKRYQPLAAETSEANDTPPAEGENVLAASSIAPAAELAGEIAKAIVPAIAEQLKPVIDGQAELAGRVEALENGPGQSQEIQSDGTGSSQNRQRGQARCMQPRRR
jgi:hypothetical protein